MQRDLLAPPKLSPRKLAIIVATISTITVIIGAVLTGAGILTLAQFAVRTAIIAAVAGAIVWTYARLLRIAARSPAQRMPAINATFGMMGSLVFLLITGIMTRGTLWGEAVIFQFLWMVPFTFGIALATAGWARRVGDSMHCPKCEYELGATPEADAPIRCPECGTPWLGRLRKGRRVRSIRLVATGIAIGLGGILILNPVFYLHSLAPALPTPFLLAVIYATPRDAGPAWRELATRPLDSEWTTTLATLVVERRGQRTFDRDPGDWFQKTAAAGTIPEELVDRYYREGLLADLHVPARVKAGRPFTAELRVTRAVLADRALGIMFAGYLAGDEPAPVGRQDKTLWAHEVHPGSDFARRDVLPQTLTAPSRPGPLRIRVVYWLVYQDSFRESLSWQPDGTPTKPSNAVWFERVELEQTVHVD